MSQSIIFEDLTTEIRLSQIMDYAGVSYRSRAWLETSNASSVSSHTACLLPSISLLEEQQPLLFLKL